MDRLVGSVEGTALSIARAAGARAVEIKGSGLTGWGWSPDSSRLAYGLKDDQRLYLADPESGLSTILAALPGPVQGLDWTPDGSALAAEYRSGNRGHDAIQLVSVATEEQTQLVATGSLP